MMAEIKNSTERLEDKVTSSKENKKNKDVEIGDKIKRNQGTSHIEAT